MADGFKLDLGCSYHKKPGFIGIDILRTEDVDVLADACNLPFKDNTFTEIYSQYVLEHVADNLSSIQEMYRVCQNGATIQLILPHATCPAFYDDITHVHKYSSRTWEHFDHDMHIITGHPNYLPEVNLKLEHFELRWWPPQIIARKVAWKRGLLNSVNNTINWFANKSPFLCERVWAWWVGGFYEIEYTLRVIK